MGHINLEYGFFGAADEALPAYPVILNQELEPYQ